MTQEVAKVRSLMLAIAHNAIDLRAGLDGYQTGEYDASHDPEGYVTSLLNALHQWCRVSGIDWNMELAIAQGFFEHDTADAPPDSEPTPPPTVEDLCCPRCGRSEGFYIEVSQCLLMFPDGTVVEDDAGEQWGDWSCCRCHACDHQGSVYQFRKVVQVEVETHG